MGRGISIGGALRFAWRLALGLVLVVIAILLLFRVAAAMREHDDAIPASSTLIATPLGRVAVALSGPENGTPVLIVPGTAGWSGFWRGVSLHLAARGYRVIAADVPPFGYSDRDPQARYDRPAQAARLAAVLQTVAGNQPAIVVAHSFGAGAATELALRAPTRVRQLVLVDPALGLLDPPAHAGSGVLPSIVLQPVVAATLTNPMATSSLLRPMLARKEAAAPWIDTIRAPMRRSGSTAGYAAWTPALFAATDAGLSRRSAGLAGMRPPVALIWGEADTVTPIAQGEALARIFRARSFQRLPGVGHIPHIEDPAQFLAALDRAMEAS
ncbi:alpha/beta hydrolase [Sphingomonas sp. ZT3P38]|uniref:alpha/beta fold hydrolase n=1 Tax=Parasphingomonas zepuensis TaxID=3096161 RepID=UPI002FC75C27